MGPLGLALALGAPTCAAALSGPMADLASLLFPSGEPGVLLDLGEEDSVFQDRSATPSSPALEDDLVGTVLDLSGNANHLIAPNDAARAPLRQGGGLSRLSLDGFDQGYEFQSGFPLNQSLDLFVGLNTADSSFMLLSHGGYHWSGSTVPDIGRIQDGPTGAITALAGTNTVHVDGVEVANNRDVVHGAISGGPHVLRISGLTLASSVTPTLAGHWQTGLRFSGDIYVLALAPTPSPTVVGDVEELIADKTGAVI